MYTISIPSVSQANFTSSSGVDVTVTFPTADMLVGDWIYVIGGFYNDGSSMGPASTSLGWEYVYYWKSELYTPALGCWRKRWNGVETSAKFRGATTSGYGTVYGRIIVRDAGSFLRQNTMEYGISTNPHCTGIENTLGDCVIIAAANAVSDTTPGTVTNYTTVNGNSAAVHPYSLSIGYRLDPNTPVEEPGSWSTWSSGSSITSVIQVPPKSGTSSTEGVTPINAIRRLTDKLKNIRKTKSKLSVIKQSNLPQRYTKKV